MLVGESIKSPPSLLADGRGFLNNGKDSAINNYFKMDVILSYVYTYRAIQHSSHHVLFAIDFNLIYFTPVYSGLTLFATCSLLPIVYYSNNNLLLIILVNQSSFRHSPFYSMLDRIIRLSSHKNHNSSSSPQSV